MEEKNGHVAMGILVTRPKGRVRPSSTRERSSQQRDIVFWN